MYDLAFDWTRSCFWVVFVGGIVANLASYTSDQCVVQRYMTTPDEKGAAKSILGKYLGNTNTFIIDLMPGDGQVFSIQKKKIKAVRINAPAIVERGEKVEVKFAVEGAVGKQVGRIDLIGPDGKLVKAYTATGRFAPAEGKFIFQFALNDKPGSWICRITHVNSGIAAEKKITVK